MQFYISLLIITYFYLVSSGFDYSKTDEITTYEVFYQNQSTQRLLANDVEGIELEIHRLNSLKPLKKASNIMFWRPQKVGSSTLLSLLVSYGYRFNMIPRRKGFIIYFIFHTTILYVYTIYDLKTCIIQIPLYFFQIATMNSFCRKIANEVASKLSEDIYKSKDTENRIEYLKKYSDGKIEGSG